MYRRGADRGGMGNIYKGGRLGKRGSGREFNKKKTIQSKMARMNKSENTVTQKPVYPILAW